jgi:heavy metal translocating P-type ATPase
MGLIPRDAADLENRLQAGTPNPDPPAPQPSEASDGQQGDLLRLNLKVTDMWCPACAWVIEEALKRTTGVHTAFCNFSIDRVRCEYDPVKTSPKLIRGVIDSLGYQSENAAETSSWRRHREFIRFSIAAFFTMNVMMLSFALYTGFVTEFSRDTIYKLSWPIFAMTTLVLFYGGSSLIKKAVGGLRAATFGMETLIMTGALTAYCFSTFNLLRGSLHLYYDTAAMLVTLALLGKWLERRAKNRVLEDLETFFALQPTKVKICSKAFPQGRYSHIDQLHPGNLFLVTEGEILPADGKVTAGSGTLNEAALTGESRPQKVSPGDRVRSGTLVLTGTFHVEAEDVGEQSTLGQMIQIMQRALGEKTPLEGRTDRVLQWFVPTIIGLAVATGIVCKMVGLTTAEATIRTVTVMVISCPCALGVAIPLARVAGISLAGKKGILVRSFACFERTPAINTLVFDKTGTLTHGRWELLDITTFPPGSENDALAVAAGLEANVEHAIGMEILRQAAARHITLPTVTDRQVLENGLTGTIGNENIKIGSAALLAAELATADVEVLRRRFTESAIPSFVYMSKAGKIWAVFTFGDKVRRTSGTTIQRLASAGYKTCLVSGDDIETTHRVAGLINIKTAHGGMVPLEKAAFVKDLQAAGGSVAMVGDGINDAPALVQADLSMAVHSGSHLMQEVADMSLMRGDPGQVVAFLNLAGPVNRTIFQNLVCAFAYNIISIPIAMSGLLSPLVAVTAMLLSSLTVIGNTLRLLKGK